MIKAGAKKRGLDLSEQFLVDCGYNGREIRSKNNKCVTCRLQNVLVNGRPLARLPNILEV